MPFDSHKNFAYATVATAPSPASSGPTLVVAAGTGTRFPTPPFNVVVWPTGVQPLSANAEILRVTGVSTDTLTISRSQEGTSPRSIVAGDQISANITAKIIMDIENTIDGLTAGGTIDGGNFSTNHAGNLKIDLGSFT